MRTLDQPNCVSPGASMGDRVFARHRGEIAAPCASDGIYPQTQGWHFRQVISLREKSLLRGSAGRGINAG